MRRRRQQGFTLLELVAAVAVFAIMGTMAYGGLVSMARNQQILSEEMDRFRALNQAVGLLERDIRGAVPRPVRDALGDPEAPLLGRTGLLTLTRAGWPNPTAADRSQLQRVSWDWDGDTLARVSWPVLDRSQSTRPLRQVLLTGVDAMNVQFLAGPGQQWTNAWPPAGAGPLQAPWPRAVRVRLEGDDFGLVERVFALAANEARP